MLQTPMNLSDFEKKALDLQAEARAATLSLTSEVLSLEKSTETATDALEAQKVLQIVAQSVQQQAHDKIAGVVSQCLESVFDEPYEFKILFEQKRGRTEAKLVFSRNGNECDPLTASGGGPVDVASFALRLSCLLLTRPATRRVLILDEPFKFLSENYRERIRVMLETLSKEMKVQIIMVTHLDELRCGKVIEL